jgi:hypothetical protein
MNIHPPRNFWEAVRYALIALGLLYAADWSVFEARRAWGSGLGSVPVEQFLKTPLKGQKAEYDYLGVVDESCPRAVFPQRVAAHWTPPCWWLRRHPEQWQ